MFLITRTISHNQNNAALTRKNWNLKSGWLLLKNQSLWPPYGIGPAIIYGRPME